MVRNVVEDLSWAELTEDQRNAAQVRVGRNLSFTPSSSTPDVPGAPLFRAAPCPHTLRTPYIVMAVSRPLQVVVGQRQGRASRRERLGGAHGQTAASVGDARVHAGDVGR